MPNQNFFDKNEKQSSVVFREDSLQPVTKRTLPTGVGIFAVAIVSCAVVGLFVWLMTLPPKQVKGEYQLPAELVSATPVPENAEEQTQAESTVEPVDTIPRDEWYLKLVNAANPLPDSYGEQEMTSFGGGYYFDERIIEPLEEMLDAAEEDDVALRVVSGYRGVERQTSRHEAEVRAYENRGYSEEDALALASMEEPTYWECEHSLGLAVDLMDSAHSATSIAFAETEEFEWLQEHAAEYGFILRYPEDKVEITGMVYEPWHYRYVGKEDAQKIQESGLCLEEYLAQGQTEQ